MFEESIPDKSDQHRVQQSSCLLIQANSAISAGVDTQGALSLPHPSGMALSSYSFCAEPWLLHSYNPDSHTHHAELL